MQTIKTKPEDLVVYHSKWKLGLFAAYILGAAILVFSLLLTEPKKHPIDTGFFLIIGAFILFFGYNFLKVVRATLNSAPALIINERGIYDNVAPVGATGWIEWEDIADVYIESYGLMRLVRYLYIAPKDQKAFLKRQPWSKRLMMYSRKMTPGAAPIAIVNIFLAIPLDDLLAQIEARKPDR